MLPKLKGSQMEPSGSTKMAVQAISQCLFETEMQQLVGRGTRNCGQKGLPFKKGWRLLTYLYYNKYDKKRSIEDIIKNLRAKNIGIGELDLKIRHVIKSNIRKNAIDALLTKNILPVPTS